MIVDLKDALIGKRCPIEVGDAVGNFGGQIRIYGRHADADEPAFLGGIDFKLIAQCIKHAVALAFAATRAADADETHHRIEFINGADCRIEFRLLFERHALSDTLQQIGRTQRPDVRVDGFLVHLRRDGIEVAALRFRIGEIARCVAGDNRELGFALILRCNHHQGCIRHGKQCRADHQQLFQTLLQGTEDGRYLDIVWRRRALCGHWELVVRVDF